MFFLRILLKHFQKIVHHYKLMYPVNPKILKSQVANEEMVNDFILTILMNLLLVQYFLALSNFLSNKFKKNGKYIKIETKTNK